MQETWVLLLVQEDSAYRWASISVHHNYWAHMPQLLKPETLESMLHSKEKPQKCEVHAPQLESSPHKSQLEKAHTQQQRPGATKNI